MIGRGNLSIILRSSVPVRGHLLLVPFLELTRRFPKGSLRHILGGQNVRTRTFCFSDFVAVWEVFYLPSSVIFRCSSTFDARHSLNRFPLAGSVTQQGNEFERRDWLERKATTFCIP